MSHFPRMLQLVRSSLLLRVLDRCTTSTFRSYKTAQRFINKSALHRSLNRQAPIDVHPEVQDALETHRPVVALESTIITHGMPVPTNFETANAVERIVRSTGAIPATVAILDGRIKIGLRQSELQKLADIQSSRPVKVSRRDIGPCISLKRNGGTTCSATLIFAGLAGINVFSTGGLGGVHRGGQDSLDVSADLHELSRCPVALVSAGVKAILDIGRTLEYLETLGVPVVTYGSKSDFPAFYSSESGFKAPWSVNSPQAAADILLAQWQLGLKNGILFGAPPPQSDDEARINNAVEQAVRESEDNGISKRGNEVTPWLLSRVEELTAGVSLRRNITLIENNAAIGGYIAVEYAKRRRELGAPKKEAKESHHKAGSDVSPPHDIHASMKWHTPNPKPYQTELIVIGCSAIDITAAPVLHQAKASGVASTSPGKIALTVGGVGRNIAEAAHRILSLGSDPRPNATLLVSPVGNDLLADSIRSQARQVHMRTDGFITIAGFRTATCNIVLDHLGSLTGGIADMNITTELTGRQIEQVICNQLPSLAVLDGNLSVGALTCIVKLLVENNVPTLFEPTSIVKSTAILPAIKAELARSRNTLGAPVTFVTPNLQELTHMYNFALSENFDLIGCPFWNLVTQSFSLDVQWRNDVGRLAKLSAGIPNSSQRLDFLTEDGVVQMAVSLLPFFQNIVVKCGERGVLVLIRLSGANTAWNNASSEPSERLVVARSRDGTQSIILKHFPALSVNPNDIVNDTGAGDSFVGALCAHVVRNPTSLHSMHALDGVIEASQQAAVLSLQSPFAVSPALTTSLAYP